jgi:hypothetical protein
VAVNDKHPRERIVIAISAKRDVHVLHGKGPSFKCDVDAVGLSASDMGLDGLPKGFPESGIIIFECVPAAVTSGGYEGPVEFDGYDYHNEATWRLPTEDELRLIVKGEFDKLSGYWSDVMSLEDWDKRQPPKGVKEEVT